MAASSSESGDAASPPSSPPVWKYKPKLVHFVSLLGVYLIATALYESWQSQKSMQALFSSLGTTGHTLTVEYAVTDGVTSDSTAAGVGGGSASGSASDTPTTTKQKSVSRSRFRRQKRNSTATIPSMIRQEQEHQHSQQRQHLPQHVQRTAESSTSTKGQEQDQKHNKNKEPLNIVLFYADDWTMKTLGMLNPVVKTPVLDELAAQGVLFTNNCVTTSICWISRSTLMTGQYAGKHQHLKIYEQNLFEGDKWNHTLFPTLKRAGYYTGFVGKWHAPSPPEHMKYTFDSREMYYGHHWDTFRGERHHVTDRNQKDAIRFLRKRPDKNQTFALAVSFFATHAWDGQPYPMQYQPMNMSAAWYPNETTVIPNPVTNTQEHWDRLPWFFTPKNEGRRRWTSRYDTPERYQVSMKNYYRMASEVDWACGKVIKELKEQGVYNNTLIIFTTDNGNFHGEHGLSDKWYAFEESIKVPLIIKDPRMPVAQHGTTNGEFTLSVDLAPTILSAANIEPPDVMQGRDIAPLYMQPEPTAAGWRKDFFYEWTQETNGRGHPAMYIPAVFALIQKEYKYIYWPQPKYEQIYNYAQDPFEEYDIFNDTEQTNLQLLLDMRDRYAYLKNLSQKGFPV